MKDSPNLDAFAPNELREFWKKYRRANRRLVRELLGLSETAPVERETVTGVQALAAYAIDAAAARTARLEGRIDAAMRIEAGLELRYEGLPEALRW